MKRKTTALLLAFSLFFTVANAQTTVPEGYTKATITLANGTTQPGYIKDNIKNNFKAFKDDDRNGVPD